MDTWLASTNYTLARKNELRKVYEETFGLVNPSTSTKSKYLKCNMFMKDESYDTYKYPRLINSRHDAFKVRTGPVFKLIEEQLFSLPWFIKHTPVDERPAEILREVHQDGAKVVGTDYSSFEALFTKQLMLACEMRLYKYMTQNIGDREWYPLVEKVLAGKNYCQGKYFSVTLDATRMSGEMCTSLGNSFMNLMAFLFIGEQIGLKSIKGRVEGDDGVFSFFGRLPTTDDFEKLGLIIKIVEYEGVTVGSFCGIIADPDELINICEPISVLLSTPYTTSQYAGASRKKAMGLLRAKAMSMIYQYPGCPILDSYARYLLRMTYGYRFVLNNRMSVFEKARFLLSYRKFKDQLPCKKCGIKTRMLMEKVFKVSIETQKYLEEMFDNRMTLEPIRDQVMINLCSSVQREYYCKYFTYVEIGLDPPFGENYYRAKYSGALDILNASK